MEKVVQGLFAPSFSSPLRILVTGGCGNIGRNILQYLLECHRVAESSRVMTLVSLDVSSITTNDLIPSVTYIKGSVAVESDVRRAFLALGPPNSSGKETRIIFHVASVIDLAPVWLATDTAYKVNVEGTNLMLRMAKEFSVDAFVYTSTLDVVYDGNPRINAPEEYNYSPNPLCIYTKTKALAEKAVLDANGTPCGSSGDHILKTVSIRPVHVFGPGDMMVEAGLNVVEKSNIILQWEGAPIHVVFVKNCAHAHVLAAIGLLERPTVVGGKAYFIRDDHVTTYAKLSGLLAKRRFPKAFELYLPYVLLLIVSYLSLLWAILERKVIRKSPPSPYTFGPLHVKLLTVTELLDNTASIRDLGYSQIVRNDEAIKIVEEWIDSSHSGNSHNYFRTS